MAPVSHSQVVVKKDACNTQFLPAQHSLSVIANHRIVNAGAVMDGLAITVDPIAPMVWDFQVQALVIRIQGITRVPDWN